MQQAQPKGYGYRYAIGTALVFCGLPFAWYLRVWLGRDDDRLFSIVLLVLALLLAISWERLFKGRYHFSPLVALLPFLFVWPAMLLAWFYGGPSDISAYYLAFVCAYYFALFTSPTQAFILMPTAFFDVAVIVAFLALGQFTLYGPASSETADIGLRLFAGDSNNPNYLAFVAGLGLVAAFNENKTWSNTSAVRWYFRVIGSSLLVFVLMLTGTRSVFIGFGFCLISAFARHAIISPTRPRGAVCRQKSSATPNSKPFWSRLLTWILIATITYASFGETLLNSTEDLLSRMVSGFVEYIGSGSGEVDESAETRRILRDTVLSEFTILGNGYSALYVDAPALQAFFDLGLLGGGAFILVTLVFPVGWWVRRVRRAKLRATQEFPFLVYLFLLPNIILHGQPYDFSVWLPVMLLFCVMARRDSI